MQLYDALGKGISLNDMSIMLASLPASAPLLFNKVRDVAKDLAMSYPISWKEICILTVMRRIQLQSGKTIPTNIDNLYDLAKEMIAAIDISTIPKEYVASLKKYPSFAISGEFKRKAIEPIKNFLSLNQKALEAMTREMLYVGSNQTDAINSPTQQQMDLVDKSIRAFLPNTKSWSILDGSCGYGILASFLINNRKSSEEFKIEGIDKSSSKICISTMMAMCDGQPSNAFKCEDLLELPEDKKYDVVIYESTWGEKIAKCKSNECYVKKSRYQKELSSCDTTDWACATKMIELMNDNAIAIWFTNSKAITNPHSNSIVDRIIKENLIASIIRLPKDSTSLNPTSPLMVIFKKGRKPKESLIQIDARKFVQKGRKVMYLPVDEIISQAVGKRKSDLSQAIDPSTMIAKDDKSTDVLLKDVTLDIFRGTDSLTDEFISNHLTGSQDRYTVLRLNDLQLGYIPNNEKNKIYLSKEEEEELRRFVLKKGDILIKSRGNVGSSLVMGKDLGRMPMCYIYDGTPDNVLATASFMVVRPDPSKLDSNYLKFYLQSRLGMEELNVQGSGKNSLMLTKSALGNIKIPLTPLEKQYRLGIDCLRYSQALAIAFEEFQRKMDEFTNYLYERFTKGE